MLSGQIAAFKFKIAKCKFILLNMQPYFSIFRPTYILSLLNHHCNSYPPPPYTEDTGVQGVI